MLIKINYIIVKNFFASSIGRGRYLTGGYAKAWISLFHGMLVS